MREILTLVQDTKKLLLQDLPKRSKPATQAPLPPPPRPKKVEAAPPPPSPPTAPKPEPTLALEKPQLEASAANDKWGSVLNKIAPTIHLHRAPPSDEGAQRSREASRAKAGAPAIPLLVSSHYAKFHTFLANLARAIDTRFGSCKLIDIAKLESSGKWEGLFASEHLRLIICPDQLLFSHPKMLKIYQEIPQKKERTLGGKPLLLLPDPSLYLKDPLLKRSLWAVLCKTL